MKHLILFSLVLLVFGSCTVEKRLYQPGWHVEWKKSLPARSDEKTETVADQPEENEADSVSTAIIREVRPEATAPTVSETKEETTAFIQEETPSTETGIAAITDSPKTEMASESHLLFQTTRAYTPLKKGFDIFHPHEDRKLPMDPLIITLWIINLVEVLLLITLILLAIFISDYALSLLAWLFFPFGLLALIAKIILGIVAYNRRTQNPGTYRDSNIFIAIIAGDLGMLLILFSLLIAILLTYG